jgi:hypothetical protein
LSARIVCPSIGTCGAARGEVRARSTLGKSFILALKSGVKFLFWGLDPLRAAGRKCAAGGLIEAMVGGLAGV